ncbi:hypothetical protein TPA0907_01990 [Micromonospora humidisoli]|nr:hypothetical protein TPA0907_01990 [Micromonospora sp. AKA109]
MPITLLGFATTPDGDAVDDQDGGDRSPMSDLATPTPRSAAAHGSHEGVWLSRYQYHSSSRGESFAGQHFVVVLQHGDRLTVRSLPGSAASSLSLDLSVEPTGSLPIGVGREPGSGSVRRHCLTWALTKDG